MSRSLIILSEVYVYFKSEVKLLLIPVAAHASPERAVQLILDEKWAAARNEVVQSGNPVLIKLYEWNLYRDNQDNLPYDQVVDFIQKNPTWPDQKKLLATSTLIFRRARIFLPFC